MPIFWQVTHGNTSKGKVFPSIREESSEVVCTRVVSRAMLRAGAKARSTVHRDPSAEKSGVRRYSREPLLGSCVGGGISRRFHPNRRASTDHPPGPTMARAEAQIPQRTYIHGSWRCEKRIIIWNTPARIPATGVHNPMIRRTPARTSTPEITEEKLSGSFTSAGT